MRNAAVVIAAFAVCLAGCGKPAPSPASDIEAELRATKERLARYEKQMGRQQPENPRPVTVETGPTDQQILAVAQDLASKTIGTPQTAWRSAGSA